MKKKIIAVLTAATILGASVPAAFAASTNVNVNVKPGTLTITAPIAVSMSEVDLDAIDDAGGHSLGTLLGAKVSDQSNAGVGWSATAQVSNFTTTSGDTIPVNKLQLTPTNLVLIGNSSGTGVSLGTVATPATTTTAISLLQATTGKGKGRYAFDVLLDLLVDVATVPGAYTATIVATVS